VDVELPVAATGDGIDGERYLVVRQLSSREIADALAGVPGFFKVVWLIGTFYAGVFNATPLLGGDEEQLCFAFQVLQNGVAALGVDEGAFAGVLGYAGLNDGKEPGFGALGLGSQRQREKGQEQRRCHQYLRLRHNPAVTFAHLWLLVLAFGFLQRTPQNFKWSSKGQRGWKPVQA